jgi:hypothetical protein
MESNFTQQGHVTAIVYTKQMLSDPVTRFTLDKSTRKNTGESV